MTALSTPKSPQPLPAQGSWTYEDYRRLPEDGWRYEVLEGVLHMTPAPSPTHQFILRNLSLALGSFLKNHPMGEFAFSPIDVLLPRDLASPVQPDLVFLKQDRLHLISSDGIKGAPDLIAEILSPSNWITDRRDKFRLYSTAGVREYWILDPEAKTVEVFTLRGDSYELLGKFSPGETARSEVLEGFEPALDEIFV